MNQPPDFYDREYNARARVPDHPTYFQRWAEQSAAARQACHLDQAYGEGDKETLDLFPAPGSKRLLVFLHGGYWRALDKSDFSWIAPPFVRSGISVAVINYALCPAVTIATITEQCRRAVAWLHHHASEYGAGDQQLIVTGHSAGGHLTAMMFATNWAEHDVPDAAIVGGVALSGLFDLEPLRYTQMNADLRLDEQSARSLSPANLQPQVSAPLIVAVGALESSEFHRQSRLIHDVWSQNCSRPMLLKDCHHFNILDVFTDPNGPIWTAARQAGLL